MFALKKKKIEIFSPCTGSVHDIQELNDGLFSEYALGKGCYFECKTGEVYSPCDGTVKSVISSNHAIGIIGKNNEEILIHIGLDSGKVSDGSFFNLHVQKNEPIRKEQLLIDYSREMLEKIDYDDKIILTVINSKDFAGFGFIEEEYCFAGEPVFYLQQ